MYFFPEKSESTRQNHIDLILQEPFLEKVHAPPICEAQPHSHCLPPHSFTSLAYTSTPQSPHRPNLCYRYRIHDPCTNSVRSPTVRTAWSSYSVNWCETCTAYIHRPFGSVKLHSIATFVLTLLDNFRSCLAQLFGDAVHI